MRTEVQGQIGYGNMKPTARNVTRERNGAHEETTFMSFRMFTDDNSKPLVVGPDGRRRRPRMVVQVILPNDDRGKKLFRHLYAGRRVLVRGDLSNRPNKTKNAEGKEVIYVNPTIRMDSLLFLDSAPQEEAKKVLTDLHERLELISKEQADNFLGALTELYATLRDDGVQETPQEEHNEFESPEDVPPPF